MNASRGVCLWCGKMMCGGHYGAEEHRMRYLREHIAATLGRRDRKTMLLKALGGFGLIILICGGTLSVLYALNW